MPAKKMPAGPTEPFQKPPTKFTYALAAHTAERRANGWYVAETVPSFAEKKVRWRGPFETVETAVLSIARALASELADRHTRSIEANNLKPQDDLYGLKPTTRLRQRSSKTLATVA